MKKLCCSNNLVIERLLLLSLIGITDRKPICLRDFTEHFVKHGLALVNLANGSYYCLPLNIILSYYRIVVNTILMISLKLTKDRLRFCAIIFKPRKKHPPAHWARTGVAIYKQGFVERLFYLILHKTAAAHMSDTASISRRRELPFRRRGRGALPLREVSHRGRSLRLRRCR